MRCWALLVLISVLLGGTVKGDLFIFMEPQRGETFRNGDTIPILLNMSQSGDAVLGAKAVCDDLKGNPTIQLREMGSGLYEGNYSIAAGYKTSVKGVEDLWLVSCVAETAEGFFERRQINVKIESLELGFQILSPGSTSFSIGDTADFAVKLFYSNGDVVTGADVFLVLGNGTTILEEESSGLYKTSVNFDSPGLRTYHLIARDTLGNTIRSDAIDIFVSQEIGLAPLVVLGILVLVLVVAILIARGGKKEKVVQRMVYGGSQEKRDPKFELKSQLRKLEARKATLEKAKDAAESAYYKRSIDQATFTKVMEDYEEDLIQVNVEMIDIKRKLSK